MKTASPCVLAINGGSSSIRFAVYTGGEALMLAGKIERIGTGRASFAVTHPPGYVGSPLQMSVGDHHAAARYLLDWLARQTVFASVRAVGHRVVHGMGHSRPERVTPRLLAELHRIVPFDPDHLPLEIGLIKVCRDRHPLLPQVACFDTAFHRTMPGVARRIAIPRRYAAKGVERYGFHGLSYSYLMEELGRLDPAARRGRVILAHLGSGASLAAVHRGKSIDTSMGLTPSAGLVMGTRSGDIDPGLGYYLERTAGMSAARFQRMVNQESGLLGVSGTSPDLRDLCARAPGDPRAAEAVELFCYQATKWIGAYAAALGGLDTLVFSAGIGENAPAVRERVCRGLGFLGVRLDGRRNARNAPIISHRSGPVRVRVMHTNEELMIARSAFRILRLRSNRETRP